MAVGLGVLVGLGVGVLVGLGVLVGVGRGVSVGVGTRVAVAVAVQVGDGVMAVVLVGVGAWVIGPPGLHATSKSTARALMSSRLIFCRLLRRSFAVLLDGFFMAAPSLSF